MTEQFLCNAMERYGITVYRLALCRTQSAADAEDVYQDVFLKLLGQDASDWDGERLKAWLIRTAMNRCADLHRFRLRRNCGQRCTFTTRRGIPLRRSPCCWMFLPPPSVPGSAGRD